MQSCNLNWFKMLLLALIIGLSTVSTHEFSKAQSEVIDFRILGEGFHRDVVVSSGSQSSDCSILLKWNIPNAYYVDPYEIWDHLQNNSARITTSVNVEQMAHQADPSVLYTLFTADAGASSLQIPIHLRYNLPSNKNYVNSHAVSPLVFQSCTCNPDCQLDENDNNSHWVFIGNALALNSELLIPVGNLGHLWYVKLFTHVTCISTALYIAYVCIITESK